MSIAAGGGTATKTTCRQSWQRWVVYCRRRKGSHSGQMARMRDAMYRARYGR